MKIGALIGAAAVSGLPLALALAAPPPTLVPYSGEAAHEGAPTPPPVEKSEPVPVIPQEEEEPLSLPEGETLHVSDFQVEGGDAAAAADIEALLAPYRNRDLSLAEIYEAAGKITAYYRAKGFLVAKAYVPKQDATSGVLLLKVVIGKYGKISLDNQSDVWDFLVQGTFDTAMAVGDPVSEDEVERAMLLTSDLPGTDMPKIAISPGQQPGTTDFAVQAASTHRISGYLLADDYGSRYTGTDRLSGGVDVNELLGLGDKFSFSGKTSEGAGLQDYRFAYAFPLTNSGLRSELAYSRTTYKLGDIYQDLDATGTVDTLEATLSYPLIRTHAESLSVAVNLANKRLWDTALGEKIDNKKDNVGTVSLENRANGSLFGFATSTDVVGSLSYGNLEYPNLEQKVANQAGADTVGEFGKLNLALSGQVALTEELSLAAALKGQKAMLRNLDGSEQMALSGPDNGVRSYYEGVLGDNGYFANLTAKYALPQIPELDAYKHSVGLFTDVGRVYLENGAYTSQRNGVRLSDIGIGYYATFEYWTDRYLIAGVEGVTSVGPNEDSGTKNPRATVLARIGVTF